MTFVSVFVGRVVKISALIFLTCQIWSWTSEDVSIDHDPFPIKVHRVQSQIHPRSKQTITVMEVDQNNKRLVPPFDVTRFEFVDVATLRSFETGAVTLADYHQMLGDLRHTEIEDRLPQGGGFTFKTISQKHSEILNAIVHDFCQTHNLRLLKEPGRMVQILENTIGTPIHFDKYPPSIRLWIPLADIDNLSLGVGDASHCHDQCADPAEARDIDWYHQPAMRMQDVVFFSGNHVPHFSIQQFHPFQKKGSEFKTQTRKSLTFTIALRDFE